MKKINSTKNNSKIINRFIRLIFSSDFQTTTKKAALCCITTFILITLMTSAGGCFAMLEEKDTISNLSFSHDGKSVVFDRCKNDGCQIQVYNLETEELAAYQSPKNERWTMAKQSYDGKKIVFSVIPITGNDLDLTQMQIGIMDTDGKNYKKLTSDPMPKIYPIFSHSGKKVLYVKASRIRKEGRTPASDYDAWEVDIETGKETRLTYFKYFHMSSVSYFPSDEKIFYRAEGPFAFPGLELPKEDIKKALRMITDEAKKRQVYIVGLLTMKKGDTFPERPYYLFEKGHPPIRPLLSKDGTKLFFEAAGKAGEFYLYSPDGNHRLVCKAGSVSSAAISPDGARLGINVPTNIFILNTSDGQIYRTICVTKGKNWDEKIKTNPSWRLLPAQPLMIMNK